MTCRCGWDGEGDHPCHGDGYTCRKPATRRMLLYPTALAGVQMKMGGYETWACDDCWAKHVTQLELHAKFLEIVKALGIKAHQGEGHLAFDDDLDGWVLAINRQIRHVFYEDDPGDGGTWVPALKGIPADRMPEALEAIYAEVVGDEPALGRQGLGEIKVSS